MPRRNHDFQSIRSEGGLLPPDLLRRILDPREKLAGTRPEDYGLPQGERLNEVITQCWNRLRRHWSEFRTAASALPEGEAATGLTNDRWSLPLLRELGFGVLTTGAAPEIDGRTYAISRFFASTPVHLVGCGLSLDRRTAGARGAAAANPHGLVQEFLNRSQGHLWGIVSNGLRFRVLRDSQALSRQSYLEFDLEAMFDGELYADFVLVWLVAHATRFVARDGGRAETCWLEEWTKLAEEQGTRALGDLRQGVEQALQILGQGLVGHPRNTALREGLRTGQLPLNDFHGQLLRVVYRLIFLFVAEDRVLEGRPLLHASDDTDAARLARERYAAHYSTGRLRELASRLKGSRHGDLWQQFHLVVGALFTDARFAAARQHLALPILGGFLWNPASTAALNPASLTGGDGAELANADFLDVIRHLAFTRQGKMLRPVDYKNLGSEELGGVYESLLALTPQVSGDGARFTFAEFAGNERKTSGSYYTPDCLVQCLLDSALDPVVAEAIKGKAGTVAEQAILALKVCDPACGSGHFLVGAAHRLARHLARVRALALGESEPSPSLYQHALRDVIGHSLYGVDINPMAVELCRVSLWLEAMEPGKPLSFLDHHIQCGNSLLGTTPELIAQGIPDDAFKAIEGDDKKACAELRKRNKAECKEIGGLFVAEDAANAEALRSAALAVDEMPDETPEAVQRKADAFAAAQTRYDCLNAKRLADAWCAAFVIEKRFPPSPIDARFQSPDPFGITQRHIVDIAQGRALPAELAGEVERLAGQYQFFHWHLAFPDVFAKGGFECVLGNPPWEGIKADPLEFFAAHTSVIARDAASRHKMLEVVLKDDPNLTRKWEEHQRFVAGSSHLIRGSGRYPLSAVGKVNTMPLFLELFWRVRWANGTAGIIVKSVIGTERDYNGIFGGITQSGSLLRFCDIVNTRGLFPDVHRQERFALLSLGPECPGRRTTYLIGCVEPEQLQDTALAQALTADELVQVSGGSCRVPLVESADEFGLIVKTRGAPSLSGLFGNDWSGLFYIMFDSGEVSGLDFTRTDACAPDMIPVYEGKYFSRYNHRLATFHGVARDDRFGKTPALHESTDSELTDPFWCVDSRYWVPRQEAKARLSERGWQHDWLVLYGRIGNPKNERTLSVAVTPLAACVSTSPALLLGKRASAEIAAIVGILSSFLVDFIVRRKVGGVTIGKNVMEELPLPSPSRLAESVPFLGGQSFLDFASIRVIELCYSAWDLQPFARSAGYDGPPFRWTAERRFICECEIDAACFHLFGMGRNDVCALLDSFCLLKERDVQTYQVYRTAQAILGIYDEMGALAAVEDPALQYCSSLHPLPGPPCDANGNFIPMAQWDPNDWPAHIHAPREGLPLTIPLETRIAASNPGIYTSQLILWLLKHSGGRCERVRLARAFALLSRPNWLVELAPETHKAVAGQWRQSFNETGYDGLFAQVLAPMLGAEVVLRREGESVYAELAQPERLLDRPWIAFDARLALGVLDSLPASVLASTPLEQARQEAERVLMAG